MVETIAKRKRTKRMHEREIGERSFTAGQMSSFELPRNYSLDRLKFRLTAQLTRVDGTAGAPKDLSGAQLIKEIQVVKNGRETLKILEPQSLMRLDQLRYGAPCHYEVDSAWDGFEDLADKDFVCDFVLDFGMWRSLQRFDTLLDTTWRGNITTLDLQIIWGQLADIMTGAFDGTLSADVTPVVRVSTEEYIDPDADPGEYAENREYMISKTVTATDPKFEHKFNVGNRFRSFVVKTYSDDVLRNDILNNVIIKTGSDVLKNRKALSLQQENKVTYAQETMPTGYYVLEFCPDGHLTRSINTMGMSDLTMEMDVTKQGTTCKIEIFPVELVKIPVTAIR